MNLFKINKDTSVICEWVKTRNAFKHTAKLMKNGRIVDETKICYLNRTWESYQFQSVLERLCDKTAELDEKTKKKFSKLLENNWVEKSKKEIDDNFKTIGAIAKIGEVLCESKKEKNNWKARMLKAGMPDLSIPDDWDTLSETEKEKRLDKVIEFTTN